MAWESDSGKQKTIAQHSGPWCEDTDREGFVMQSRYGCEAGIVAILVGVCFSGCAGTGDAWRSDGRTSNEEQRGPELIENKTTAFSHSDALEVEARKQRIFPVPR